MQEFGDLSKQQEVRIIDIHESDEGLLESSVFAGEVSVWGVSHYRGVCVLQEAGLAATPHTFAKQMVRVFGKGFLCWQGYMWMLKYQI